MTKDNNQNERRKISHTGTLNLAGHEIRCYNLEDGTRVLSGAGMRQALALVNEKDDNPSGSRITRLLGQKSLEPYFYEKKGRRREYYEPIQCYQGEKLINGYEATVLADICEAILDARRDARMRGEELGPRQEIVAVRCEILLAAFARVGITALVDEATGYQYYRERQELEKIVNAHIAEELQPWTKTFPDDFYKEIFRLRGWDFTLKSIKGKRPQIIGTWTKQFIYEQLPKGVMEELYERTPKNEKGEKTAKLHQSLSPNVGHPSLTRQITRVIALMQVSDTWEEFVDQFAKLEQRDKNVAVQGGLKFPK